LLEKLLSAMLTGVVPERYLLTTITVRAPSELRCAAKRRDIIRIGSLRRHAGIADPDRLPS